MSSLTFNRLNEIFLYDMLLSSAHGITEVGPERTIINNSQQGAFASAQPSNNKSVQSEIHAPKPDLQSSTWSPPLSVNAAAAKTEKDSSDPRPVVRPIRAIRPEIAALKTQKYSVVSCSHACLLDPQCIVPEDGMTIHHGDFDDVLSCRLINLKSEATGTGQKTPKPWTNNGTISAQYVLDLGRTNSNDINDPRISRIVLADDDARRLHNASKQKGCSTIDFQKVLDDSHVYGKSTEKIVCQIQCKAIINIESLAAVKQDLVGDCSVILTENTDPSSKYRHIYFVQVRPNPWLSFCFVLVSAMTVRPEQAGTEFQTLNATDNSERVQNLQELRLETKTDIKTEDSIQTTTHRVNEKVARTFESKDVDIACVRQTVSHMEVVSVEDQLVRVFCEQVALDFEPDSACKAPSPRPNGGHCKAPLRRPNCGPAPSDPARVALDATAPR